MTEPQISERDVDDLLSQFNGNARATIRALMHDLAIMVDRNNDAGSRGFLRREQRLSVGWGEGEREPRVK